MWFKKRKTENEIILDFLYHISRRQIAEHLAKYNKDCQFIRLPKEFEDYVSSLYPNGYGNVKIKSLFGVDVKLY